MSSKRPEEKDYYELLGVGRDATSEEIKHAYREIARVYHPDSNFYAEIIDVPPNERDIQIFKLVTAAYDVLMDSEKRVAYDRTLLRGLKDWSEAEGAPVRPPSGWEERPRPAARPVQQRGFGQFQKDEPLTKSSAQAMRPMTDRLQTTRRGLSEKILLFLGLGLPLLTLAGAAIYIYLRSRR